MPKLRFISFFAGIGGIDLGLERAGHECVGQVEINPFCQRVLAKHWPETWRHDDITTLKTEDIPAADLWAGGFPCQDISNAGKRAGIHGERSGLFFDFMRLAAYIRPRILLLENVGALVDRGLSTVLGTLAESGYDAEWDCIPAAAVGAPHIRNRIFILGYTDHQSKPIVPEHDEASGVPAMGADASRFYAQRQHARPWEKQSRGSDWWGVEPAVDRVADGVPARVDRLTALGNAVVPQVAEYIGRLLMESPVE